MARTTRLAAIGALVRALRGATRPGEPGLRERLGALPRLVRATSSVAYDGTSRGRLAAVGAAILYVVSPIDLVPEAVLPLIGLADDALVISWIAATLLGETDAFLRWERGRGGKVDPGARPSGVGDPDVIAGQVIR